MNVTGEIIWHLGEENHAKLTYSESQQAYSIDTVLVPSQFRGQGIGSQLINKVILLADAEKKEIFLSARPIGPNDEEKLMRLVLYYERFGFQTIDRGLSVVYMKRPRAELSVNTQEKPLTASASE
jgi:predicted GNAT family acetyltransferase